MQTQTDRPVRIPLGWIPVCIDQQQGTGDKLELELHFKQAPEVFQVLDVQFAVYGASHAWD